MKRIALALLTMSMGFVCASESRAVDGDGRRGKTPAGQHAQARQPSTALPRLQRGPDGRILDEQWQKDVERRAGKETAASKTPHNAARDAGRYAKDAFKRGAGEWPKTDPAGKAGKNTPGKARSPAGKVAAKAPPRGVAKGTPRAGGGKALKAAGGIGAAVGGGVAAGHLIANSKKLEADLRAGRITQDEFNRAQATGAVEAAGTLIAIKKLTPAGMAANAVVGTDPISLGVDAVGDVINGTNNAEKSIANVGRKLEAHGKGVEKLVTNPEGWAKDTKRNIEAEAKKTAHDINKTAKDVDKAAKHIGKAVNKAGKDVDKFFKGAFGK